MNRILSAGLFLALVLSITAEAAQPFSDPETPVAGAEPALVGGVEDTTAAIPLEARDPTDDDSDDDVLSPEEVLADGKARQLPSMTGDVENLLEDKIPSSNSVASVSRHEDSAPAPEAPREATAPAATDIEAETLPSTTTVAGVESTAEDTTAEASTTVAPTPSHAFAAAATLSLIVCGLTTTM